MAADATGHTAAGAAAGQPPGALQQQTDTATSLLPYQRADAVSETAAVALLKPT